MTIMQIKEELSENMEEVGKRDNGGKTLQLEE